MVSAYELTYLLNPALRSEEREEVEGKLETILRENEGEVIEKVPLGRKRLAYPIGQEKYGEYFYWTLRTTPASTKAIDSYARSSPTILRHLLVKL